MNGITASRVTGGLMIAAALASTAAFVGLGSVFNYPDVLREPTEQILARFTADRTTIITLFLLLAAAGAMIPVAVLVGRLGTTVASRLAVTTGVIAGVVQVLGLLRWAYAVPVLADAAAVPETRAVAIVGFDVLHRYLGVGVGETLGYLATALWTLLVLASGILDGLMPRWSHWVGGLAAVGILAGIAEPAGLEAAGTINFAGYLLWSLWLVGFGIALFHAASAQPMSRASGQDRALALR